MRRRKCAKHGRPAHASIARACVLAVLLCWAPLECRCRKPCPPVPVVGARDFTAAQEAHQQAVADLDHSARGWSFREEGSHRHEGRLLVQ